MKKLFVSTGLAAIGVIGLQSANGQGLDLVSAKAWSVSGTLRGFYDDNYDISNTKRGSWGMEVSPTVSVNVPGKQTDMGIRYIYGLYYYNDRDNLGLDPYDQSHEVDFWLDHAINERWKINFTDTFTGGSDPNLQNAESGAIYRVNSDNIANHANISLDTQWTKLFGTSLHYGNDFYDYDNSGATVNPLAGTPNGSIFTVPGNSTFYNPATANMYSALGNNGASLAGLLDRIEQNVGLDLNWTLSPETMFFVGYTFSWVNYLGNEPIATFNYQNPNAVGGSNPFGYQSYVFNSSSRNGATQEGHVGLSHQFTANITLNAQVGVSYSDNSNDPFQHSEVISPTANVSLNYTYSPGSYVQVGVAQAHNATDVVEPGINGSLTQYQDTTTVFADINQKLTDKLMGTITGQYTYSSYEGGAAASTDGDSGIDAGLNLTYQINRHFSADAGYNFDDLFSELAGRPFSRNRVYLGMSASY